MQIEQFTAAIKTASQLTNHNHKSPIYQTVRIDPQSVTGVAVTGTGFTFSTVKLITGDSFEPVAVNAKQLLTRLKIIPKKTDIALFTVDGQLQIKWSTGSFSLSTLPADDFPHPSTISNPLQTIGLDAAILKQSLDQVMAAQAVKDVRYYLNGVLFEFTGSEHHPLNLVTTCGSRLHKTDMLITGHVEKPVQVIVPSDIVKAIYKSLPKSGQVNMQIEQTADYKKQLIFAMDNLTVQTVSVDGKFPDYQRVIPSAPDRKNLVVVNRLDMIAGLKEMTVFSDQKFKAVKLSIKADKMIISTRSGDETEYSKELHVCNRETVEMTIGFNIQYLIDALSALSCTGITLRFGEVSQSLLIVEDNLHIVVMPMRI